MPNLGAHLQEIAPEMDAESAVELLGVSFEDIQRELFYRAAKKREAALKQLALAQRAGGERKFIKAAGEAGAAGYQEMMIPPASYHYWGQRLGYQCWDDPQFRREYLRDNAGARVRSTSGNLTITKPDFAGGSQEARKPNHSAPNTRAALSPVRRGVRGKRGRWAT